MLSTALLLLLAAMAAATIRRVTAAESHLVEHFDRRFTQLRTEVTMSQQTVIDAVVSTLRHAKTELDAKLADLQAKIDAGVPAEQLDLSELQAVAQSLEDVVPDVEAVDVEAAPAVDEAVVVDDVEPVVDEPAEPVVGE